MEEGEARKLRLGLRNIVKGGKWVRVRVGGKGERHKIDLKVDGKGKI